MDNNQVKYLYSEYNYPKYNPLNDANVPIPEKYSSNLFPEQISYYNYNGKQDFNNYRILIPGVGLGNDLISMGYLLRDYKNVELVGIDISRKQLDICRERVKKYNMKNVELLEMSLLDLDYKIHGTFDLIICIGVLHHLKNPDKGLKKLKNVLKDDGLMTIMVYGLYGRTGIYQMQDLMKLVNRNVNVNNYSEKIQNFKNIHKQLPNNNWFRLGEHLVHDHRQYDEGIVDLILHCQDRAYNVTELYNWVENNGMNIMEFSPDTRYKYKFKIENVNYTDNIIDNYSLNELFFGDIMKHCFYISKNKNIKADINDIDMIPIFVLILKENIDKILNYYTTSKNIIVNTHLCYKLNKNNINNEWINNNTKIQFTVELNDITFNILKNIDGQKSLREIFNIIRINNLSNNELLELFKPVYNTFELYDLILLKKK
jgi:SAM-dependent methyltransferase